MAQDFLGNAVSTSDAGVLAAIDAFGRAMLTYEAGAGRILKAANAAHDVALLNAYAGALLMLMESPQGPGRARPFLERAEAAPGANPREAAAIAFLRAWLGEDLEAALAISAEAVERWPRDLVMLKLHHYLAFNAGDFPAMLKTALAAHAASADVPQAHGVLAFAYEECHLMRPAEDAARRALEMSTADPWAEHALAHVLLTEGRIEEGARFMAQASPRWAGLNSFMATHNWWHLALFALSRGRTADVLAAFDQHVWAGDRDFSQDQVNAVSLLARLEFAGVDVGDRWMEVGERLAARGVDVEQPFLALHYLYGLARAARPEAEPLLAAIRERPANASAFMRPIWAEAGVPAAEAIAAHLAGDHARAIEQMDRAVPHLARIGGSHAQRDLFHQIRLTSAIAAGRLVEAQQALELRRSVEPRSVPVNQALGRVYAGLGLPAQADEARRRADAALAAG